MLTVTAFHGARVPFDLADINLDAISMAGLPSISVPAGLSEGLPIGLQITAKYMDELGLYNLAGQFQQATDHQDLKPSVVTPES